MMAELIEFDGPANWHCLGQQYVTLTHGGVKAQGEPFYTTCETENEAFAKFWVEYEKFRQGAEQIAWRLRPVCEQQEDRFIVRARLARFPEVSE